MVILVILIIVSLALGLLAIDIDDYTSLQCLSDLSYLSIILISVESKAVEYVLGFEGPGVLTQRADLADRSRV